LFGVWATLVTNAIFTYKIILLLKYHYQLKPN